MAYASLHYVTKLLVVSCASSVEQDYLEKELKKNKIAG